MYGYANPDNDKKLYTFSELAERLEIGRNKLMEFLRKESVLYLDKWRDNIPTEEYEGKGYFSVTTKLVENSTTPLVTLVTSEGFDFIQDLLSKRNNHVTS